MSPINCIFESAGKEMTLVYVEKKRKQGHGQSANGWEKGGPGAGAGLAWPWPGPGSYSDSWPCPWAAGHPHPRYFEKRKRAQTRQVQGNSHCYFSLLLGGVSLLRMKKQNAVLFFYFFFSRYDGAPVLV